MWLWKHTSIHDCHAPRPLQPPFLNQPNQPINPSPKQFTSKPDTTCLSGCAMETAAMDKCAAMAHEISKKCGCVPHTNQVSLCV